MAQVARTRKEQGPSEKPRLGVVEPLVPEKALERQLEDELEANVQALVEKKAPRLLGNTIGLLLAFLGTAFAFWFAGRLPAGEVFTPWLYVAAIVGLASALIDMMEPRALPLLMKLPVLVVQIALTVWLLQHVTDAWVPWWDGGLIALRVPDVTIGNFAGTFLARVLLGIGVFGLGAATLSTFVKAARAFAHPEASAG